MEFSNKMGSFRLVALIFVGMLLAGAELFAAGSLKGIIVDSENSLAMPGARVFLDNTSYGAIAKHNGEFTIMNVPVGDYKLVVSYIGYEKFEKDIKIIDNKTSYEKIEMKAGLVQSKTVVVVGEALKGQAKALTQQQNNLQISNIVASDQIGKFPDANIGDAMKRIPGITVQYDQGEARFGLVRGTAARLNSVMINGERIPSAEAEDRSVQLDLVSADMIQNIEVSKAVTPDMDADAIGGAINLVTRTTPNAQRASVTLGSGYNMLSEKPIYNTSVVAGDRFFDNKLGVIVSGSYKNHHLGSDNFEAEWFQDDLGNAQIGEFQMRAYDVQRVRKSISAGLDYKLNNDHSFYVNTILTQRNDWENRFRTTYKLEDGDNDGIPNGNGIITGAEIRRETKGGIGNDANDYARLEDQKAYNFSFGGDHLFGDILKMDWSATWAKASEERPNERYISYRTKSADVQVGGLNTEEPIITQLTSNDLSEWSLKEITEEYQYTEDIDLNARMDFEMPLMQGEYKSILKFGGRYRGKDKLRDNNFFEYEPLNGLESMTDLRLVDKTDGDFLAGNYSLGRYVDKKDLGDLDLANSSQFEKKDVPSEYLGGNFDATEKITGGYAMITQNVGSNFTALLGARIEHTSVDYNANAYDDETDSATPTHGSDSYSNFLPGLHLKYNFTRDLLVRAAWTNTIARPNYFDIAPYRILEVDKNRIEVGNPDLEPTKSMNLDLMAENYFESIGLISAGVFYKDLSNFIFAYRENDYYDASTDVTYDRYTQPRNGASAKIYGFEIGAQRQLDFLPSFLKNISLYANYTYTKSEVDGLPMEGRQDEKLGLPGTAENMINASIAYDTKEFTLRLSMNHTSDYVDEFGEKAFEDRYYDKQTFVDVNASYALTEQFRIYAEANNITNQPLRYYQGISGRTMQAEYYNMRFNFGVKFDL